MSRTPVAASNRNNASTLVQDTEPDDLLKIISFQYRLVIEYKDTCILFSILKGNFDVAVIHSMNLITLDQNTGRKTL
jgi:hypothetical protein